MTTIRGRGGRRIRTAEIAWGAWTFVISILAVSILTAGFLLGCFWQSQH